MNYTIAPPDFRYERAEILRLWERNLPHAALARYKWLYEDGAAIGRVAQSPAGDAVGAAGLLPRRMKVFDETVVAGQAIDLNVDQTHRALGPALRLQRAVAAAADERQFGLIYALPNQQSEAVFRRMGYQVVGELQRWAKPLRWESVAARHSGLRASRRLVSRCADFLLHLGSREIRIGQPANLRLEVRENFDPRFDELWDSVAGNLSVAGERTSDYLDWRFRQCPVASHRILCLTSLNGELLAYLVFSQRAGTFYLNDFLARRDEHLDLVLAGLLRLARRAGAAAVITVFLGEPRVGRCLRRFGFWGRSSDWKVVVYSPKLPEGLHTQAVLQAQNWYLTRADIDTEF